MSYNDRRNGVHAFASSSSTSLSAPYSFDPFAEEEPKPKKQPKPRVRRCKECRQPTASDGYGEFVHADTGLYGDYEAGQLLHVAS